MEHCWHGNWYVEHSDGFNSKWGNYYQHEQRCCWCGATRRVTYGHVKSEHPSGHGNFAPYVTTSQEIVDYDRPWLGTKGYITDKCPERKGEVQDGKLHSQGS